jgi:FkbM family methyltransferase
MKHKIKLILQKILGINTYLFIFSIFKSVFLKFDKNEQSIFIFMDKLSDGGTILDIGANIGITSLVFCKKNRDEVIAFEPIITNYKVLRRIKKFKRLDNLEIFPIALGSHTGVVDMVMPIDNGVVQQGLSHITNNMESNTGQHYQVEIKRLDDILDTFSVKNDNLSMKIDVEGFEFEVLLGAVNTIRKYRPIIHIELWEINSSTKCLELLTELNYEIMGLKNKVLVSVTKYEHLSSMSSNNFICFPK